MEITKTFTNTFRDMLRAKLRWFFRRSLYRYAIGIALVTYGLHRADPTMNVADMIVRGVIYFVFLSGGVLLLHIVAAAIQSRHIMPRTITFTEDELIVSHKGETAHRGWDWIISAEESPTTIALLVQKMPRLELFLQKSQLSETEYDALHEWLVSHRKLPAKDTVG